MAERVAVDAAPVASHEGRNEQEQRALRLVKVGNQPVHDFKPVGRHKKYLGGCI